MGQENTAGDEPEQETEIVQEVTEEPSQELTASSVETELHQFLTEQQREILAFEKKFFKFAGVKERAIAQELGLTPVQYYQQVSALLDHPAAYAAEPMLVSRLQELRNSRKRRRVF